MKHAQPGARAGGHDMFVEAALINFVAGNIKLASNLKESARHQMGRLFLEREVREIPIVAGAENFTCLNVFFFLNCLF